ncbi:helix-turn-helix domain-containing protein [Enterococcus sp. AZ109]|uniref:helix-turn-helix domain-containing protein n=1 Tax=Enterococcus sp. AZ109 TaxID=2774634 RepID=UPI003F22E28E
MKIVLKKTNLKYMMRENGDDVYSLATRMNVPPSTIYRIFNGDRGVGSQMIAKLLLAYDLSEQDFYRLFMISP